ncbi:hypothetical protein HDV02_005373 [Globomyces sp. JEL0801]|nr:hypothetical protein HDV02_005373 [Globomyces sp. JEL0801]
MSTDFLTVINSIPYPSDLTSSNFKSDFNLENAPDLNDLLARFLEDSCDDCSCLPSTSVVPGQNCCPPFSPLLSSAELFQMSDMSSLSDCLNSNSLVPKYDLSPNLPVQNPINFDFGDLNPILDPLTSLVNTLSPTLSCDSTTSTIEAKSKGSIPLHPSVNGVSKKSAKPSDKEKKVLERRKKNTESARRSRLLKQVHMEELEEQVKLFKKRIEELELELKQSKDIIEKISSH